jgi:hypothetical protein
MIQRLLALALCGVLLCACGPRTVTGTLVCDECEAIGQPAYIWMNPDGSALACRAPWGTEVTMHRKMDGRWLVTVGDCSGFVSERLVQTAP